MESSYISNYLPTKAETNTENLTAGLVDTVASVFHMLDVLHDLPTTPPSLYIDLEGENLSRHGSISLPQIFVLPNNFTYLVDVYRLQNEAFTTTHGVHGNNLKAILESEAIPKVMFDVRADSDALYSHFQIELAGIQDLQLFELATRHFPKRFVNGLAKCIERDANLSWAEKSRWRMAKEKGRKLFAPELGGNYQVFNVRPLTEDIMTYCVQDVQFLPRLWSHYRLKLTPFWKAKIEKATRDRIALSKSHDFSAKGQHMALAPSDWL